MPAIGFALSLLQYAPLVAEGVSGALEMFNWGKDALGRMNDEKRDPTAEEWAELDRLTAGFREKLHSDEV